jgi:hypothetical protein
MRAVEMSRREWKEEIDGKQSKANVVRRDQFFTWQPCGLDE